MHPTRIEFDIGQTVYGQPLRLVRHKTSTNQPCWALIQDAGSQRDDPATVDGLSDDAILKMAEAVKSANGAGRFT